MTDHLSIQLLNVSKSYEIHHEKPTLVEKFITKQNETFWALKDINLSVKKGERVGIIGPNGSGKTTLLKVIAGITSQTSGLIQVNGKIVTLIDLEAGFHRDLTGEQNIYLNGMLLGMTKKDISRQLVSIINFASIRQFIDAPMFTYSSGMAMRLGFSVAIHAKPEILILDESIQTGDKFFFARMHKALRTLFKSGITVILTSHSREIIESYCSRIIILDKGRITMDGKRNILNTYFT